MGAQRHRGLFAAGVLLLLPGVAEASTNTARCLEIMATEFQEPCDKLATYDMSAMPACCQATADLNALGCFTVPAIAMSLNQDPSWAQSAGSFGQLCASYLMGEPWMKPYEPHYDMGCAAKSDEDVDAERLGFLAMFYEYFEMGRFGDKDDEATYEASQTGLRMMLTRTDGMPVTLDSSGLGRYSDAESVAEYYGLAMPFTTRVNPPPTEFDSPGATRWTAKQIFGCNSVLLEEVTEATGNLSYWSAYRFDFDQCSGTIAGMKGWAPEQLLKEYMEFADEDSSAQKYCAEVMRQCGAQEPYTSEQDCLDYFWSIPRQAQGCKHSTQGNSRTCRLKHHFLMFERPDIHCYHVSKGMADVNGKVKCSDEECTGSTGNDAFEELMSSVSTGYWRDQAFIGPLGGYSGNAPAEEDWGAYQCGAAPATTPPPAPTPMGPDRCVQVAASVLDRVRTQGYEPRYCP